MAMFKNRRYGGNGHSTRYGSKAFRGFGNFKKSYGNGRLNNRSFNNRFNRSKPWDFKKDYKSPQFASSGGAALTYGNRQMATLYNPFSMKNNQPKWPDGKVTYSIGRKHQAASELNAEEAVICLFPGVNNWCTAYLSTANTTGAKFNLFLNHQSQLSVSYTYEEVTAKTLKYHQWTLPPTTFRFDAWRPVSYAMQIRCINNDEKNEGWYEAIRIPKPCMDHTFGICIDNESNNVPTVQVGNVLPQSQILQKWSVADHWTCQPTYVTGKLKDIGNYMFQLNHQLRDNDLQPLKNFNVLEDAAITEEFTLYNASMTNGLHLVFPKDKVTTQETFTGADVEDFRNTVYNNNLDIILVRIHGQTDTKLLVHSVANIEFTVKENTEWAMYTSPSYQAKDALNEYLDSRSKYHRQPQQFLKNTYINRENKFYN